ncbi:uncharacterized protein (TIGR02597 family) [Prosthecobacter fusiformis]|uniref:Uncharacterized protein (TIGR02597 family) n=1 Tax=Prosthecobacter fusiformis TaxID=48464 RepID=A0A4R7RP98_9BACT|nr:hypothetical protein [Prosthecobacter fusiformis]TDU67252.1 uncharacterized protein (TIGR02597 family) [Prosthecobacter fusiformis]
MKRFFCLAASCLLAASVYAEVLVTTPVMGFVTLNVLPGTNFIGFALLPAMELQGVANISPQRTSLFLQGSQIELAENQFNGGTHATHAVEIVTASGSVGFTTEITGTLAEDNEITLASPIPANVQDGATVKIWKLWTLADVFGAPPVSGLTVGPEPALADVIQIPNGSGFDQYFYANGAGSYTQGWRLIGDATTNQAKVPLKLNGGFAIRAGTSKSITIVGQVKPGQTLVNLQPGNNFVANLCPVKFDAADVNPDQVGRNLGNSGLSTDLTPGVHYRQADLVLIWNGTGYDQYYYSSGGLAGQGWRLLGGDNSDRSAVPLPDGAYVIFRRGDATSIQLDLGEF